MLKFLSLFLVFLSGSMLRAQIPGCIDPAASNYNPAATFNDGGCTYGPSSAAPLLLATLSDSLSELSGLIKACQDLLGHNDGGNEDRLFRLQGNTGAVLNSSPLPLALTDWEDLAVGPAHVFLGDFGNNAGQRDTLSIYRLALNEVCNGSIQSIDTLRFWYADAPTGTLHADSHNLDCEAMAVYRDSLWLFSKNRMGNQVRIYGLPSLPGLYGIQALDSIPVVGQITGADILGDSCMALVGYAPPFYVPFLVLGFASDLGAPWKGCLRRIDLGSVLQMGQLEAVCFWAGTELRLGSEAVSALGLGPRLYGLNVSSFLLLPSLGINPSESASVLWCKKKTNEIEIRGLVPGKELELVNESGKSLWRQTAGGSTERIQLVAHSDTVICRQGEKRSRCLIER
jgi:hypothetical protein